MNRLPFALAVLLSLCLLARAEEPPATQPTGEAATKEAVLQAFRDYNDAMMRVDEPAMADLQHTTTDAEKKFSQALIKGDAAVAKLKKAAAEAYGPPAGQMVGTAINDIGNDQLQHAKVQVDGDTAVITFGMQSTAAGQSIRMVRVNDQWKFDMTHPAERQDQLARMSENLTARAERIEALAASAKARTFETVEELIEELGKRGI